MEKKYFFVSQIRKSAFLMTVLYVYYNTFFLEYLARPSANFSLGNCSREEMWNVCDTCDCDGDNCPTRHRDTQQGGWRGPAPEVILSPDTDHDGYLRSPGSSVWTMLTSDNERSVGRQSALASRVKNEAETKFLWFKVVPRLSFINYMQPVSK